MNPDPLGGLASSVIPILLDTAAKSFLLMALACLAILAMKRFCAAARHLVWFLAVASLLLLPVLSVTLPGWHILPRWIGAAAAGQAPHPDTPLPASLALPPSEALPDAFPAGPTPARHAPPATELRPPSPAPTRTAALPSSLAVNWRSWALVVWVAVAGLAMFPTAIGMLSLWRLGRGARRESASSWLELLNRLLEALRFARRVDLLKSARRQMPMTWGVLRPRLLLPEESQEWPDNRRRVVLLHELAHAKRWDYLTNLVTQLVCALYWFNPLVWLAARRMVTERERACDDVVLRHGAKPADYAEQVLHIAANLRTGHFAAASGIAMARPSKLEGRLLAILDAKRSRAALTRVALTVSVAVMALLVVPLAMTKAARTSQAGDSAGAGTVAMTAHVVGTDGKLCAASIMFWRAGETTTTALPTRESFWDLSSRAMRWGDTVNGKTWEPVRSVGIVADATADKLPPGEYLVTAQLGSGLSPYGVSKVISVDGSTPAIDVTIRLQDGPSLIVSLVDAATQKPVPMPSGNSRGAWRAIALTRDDGLPITEWSGQRWWSPRTEDGLIRLDHLQPGKYHLSAYCPAYEFGKVEYVAPDDPIDIEIVAGQDREIRVPMKRWVFPEDEVRRRWPFVAQGRVTDERGQPLEDVTVNVHCGMGTLFQTGETKTGADGRYTLRFRGGVTSPEDGHATRQVAGIGVARSGYVEASRSPAGDLMMDSRPPAESENRSGLILPDEPFALDFVMKPDKQNPAVEISAAPDATTLRELLVAGKWDDALKLTKPADRCPGSHNWSEGLIQTTTPIVLDWDMCVAAGKGNDDAQRPHVYRYPWLEFVQEPKGLSAKLHLKHDSWPKTAWKVRLQRVDRAGAAVITQWQDEKVVENTGFVERIPSIDEAEVTFRLNNDPVFRASPGMLYMVSIETLWTEQGNPVRWDEPMPLSLDLGTREYSRVFHGESLTLTQADDDALAVTVAASVLSSPECRWRLSLDLADDAGKAVASAELHFNNWEGKQTTPRVFRPGIRWLSDGGARPLSDAKRWTFRIEQTTGAADQDIPSTLTQEATRQDHGLQEILEALARRDRMYRDARLRFEYKRRTSGTDSPEVAVEGCSLLTHRGMIREEMPLGTGNDKTQRLVHIRNGGERAEARLGAKDPSSGAWPVSALSYHAHNHGHNIESTLGPAILGPPRWIRDRWQEMQRIGKLSIEQKEIDGIRCIVVTSVLDGHTVSLVPEFDWAPLQCLSTTYHYYRRHDGYWFPTKVKMLTLASVYQFRDELDIERVEVLNDIPPHSFEIPQPSAGTLVNVAYPKWEQAWESTDLKPQQVKDSVRSEHRFTWKEPLEGKDSLIWTISRHWRNDDPVRLSLGEIVPGSSTAPGAALPFLSPDGSKIVWARYDATAKRLKVTQAPGQP